MTDWSSSSAPVVPAHGFLTIRNTTDVPPQYAGTQPRTTGSPSQAEPGNAPPANTALVPDLINAFDNELVILRPRHADGHLESDESMTSGLLPVDSYDFSGLTSPGDASAGTDLEWHYVRPNDPFVGKAWNFVYPGPIC